MSPLPDSPAAKRTFAACLALPLALFACTAAADVRKSAATAHTIEWPVEWAIVRIAECVSDGSAICGATTAACVSITQRAAGIRFVWRTATVRRTTGAAIARARAIDGSTRASSLLERSR